MVYTDAIDEDIKASPEDVEKELCYDCYDKVWGLGEVSLDVPSLSLRLERLSSILTWVHSEIRS